MLFSPALVSTPLAARAGLLMALVLAVAVEALARHHQDPFDRIMGAQALPEPMRLMSIDLLVASSSDTAIKI